MIDDVATDGSTSSEKNRPSSTRRTRRVRMTGKERREQLLDIGRILFADKGFEGTSVEEIAAEPASPSRSSTNTSAARRACTPSWWTARCASSSTW